MYMCTARAGITLGDGSRIECGQPVPGAENWPYAVLQSHVRLGYIVKAAAKGEDKVAGEPSGADWASHGTTKKVFSKNKKRRA